MPIDPRHCPACGTSVETPAIAEPDDTIRFTCSRCGTHRFTSPAIEDLTDVRRRPEHVALLSFKLTRTAPSVVISGALIQDFVSSGGLPTPVERIDLLLDYMASRGDAGLRLPLIASTLVGRLGCLDANGASWVRLQASNEGYIEGDNQVNYRLSLKGWQRRTTWLQGGADSTHAFMAMHYSAEMQRVFLDHLVPAVAATGFELRTANGPHQPAGSIDDRMRVEIRTSRFMVCDITDGNRGAYWEAGFAEGLGRPVFYVCRADVLSDPDHQHQPHFDTRQSLIVPWDPQDMGPGMLKLKQAIRATLPDQARMED